MPFLWEVLNGAYFSLRQERLQKSLHDKEHQVEALSKAEVFSFCHTSACSSNYPPILLHTVTTISFGFGAAQRVKRDFHVYIVGPDVPVNGDSLTVSSERHGPHEQRA